MIGIIILNYMNWEVTEKCIKSIFDTINDINMHIYLVDNASTNSPPDTILNLVNDCRISLIINKKNMGYSAGNNIGIKKALDDGCEEILIANSDVIFLKSSIEKMLSFLQNHEVEIVGPKLISLNGEIQYPSMCIRTGLKEKYLTRTFIRKIFRNLCKNYYCFDNANNMPLKVHAVSGACFLMSRKCALNITPFDENTFLFEEELIIGIQMEKKGYKTIYYPESAVIHAHGESTNHVRAFSFICFVESEIYYCKRYLRASIVEILPLYFIRTASYFYRIFIDKEFAYNFLKYFKSTVPKIFIKY